MSVRHVTGRRPDGAPHLADVVGDLLAVDGDVATIATRDDVVEVGLEHVVTARLVTPSTADELALEAVTARGWRPAETAELGGWLLRANAGFTHRANSVLPVRPPGMPVGTALERAGAWYAERGLPLCLQVPVEARRLLDADLGERGFLAGPTAEVWVRRLGLDDASTPDGGPEVLVESAPSPGWWATFRGGTVTEASSAGVLTRHDQVGFARIELDGRTVAVGRGSVDDGWLGVTEIEVLEPYRRRGLAARLVLALHHWGVARGASRAYLQVLADNHPARRVYARLGYWHHHDYRYRTAAPASD